MFIPERRLLLGGVFSCLQILTRLDLKKMSSLNVNAAGKGCETLRIRVKFGKNPYSNEFTCSRCGHRFSNGGFFMRIEYAGTLIDIPVCPACWGNEELFEGMIELDNHEAAHPIGLA